MTGEPPETLEMRVRVFAICAELLNFGVAFEAVLPIMEHAARQRIILREVEQNAPAIDTGSEIEQS